MYTVVFIDTEVSTGSDTVLDYGAAADGSTHIHTKSARAFEDFLVQNSTGGKRFLCGHNIVHHDSRYIRQQMQAAGITDMIDTLYLSPLLFPSKPYHALLKDDNLQTDSLNNPLNDAIKAMELFYDEVNAFQSLNELQKDIYAGLLSTKEEFRGFFLISTIIRMGMPPLSSKVFIMENCAATATLRVLQSVIRWSLPMCWQ